MFLSALDGNCLAVNEAYCKLLDRPPEDFIGFAWINNLHPEDQARVLELAKVAISTHEEFHGQHRYVNTDGSEIYAQVDTVLIFENEQPIAHIGTVANLTDNQILRTAMTDQAAMLTAMTTAMSEGVVVQNSEGEIIVCNPAAEKILGITADQMMGRTSMDPRWRSIREDGTDFPGSEHPVSISLRDAVAVRNVTMGIHHPDGNLRWIKVNSNPMIGPSGEITAAVATFTDVTEQRHYMELVDEQVLALNQIQVELEIQRNELEHLNSKLRFQAETDALTLLLNRGAIFDRLQSICTLRTNKDFGVVLFDIDHFKSINDRFGHDVGDQVLQIVASIASEHLPNGSAVGRFGGEEFLVIGTELTQVELTIIAENIRQALENCHDAPTKITASFGVAHAMSCNNPKQLIKEADQKMYIAKNSGRNQVVSEQKPAA